MALQESENFSFDIDRMDGLVGKKRRRAWIMGNRMVLEPIVEVTNECGGMIEIGDAEERMLQGRTICWAGKGDGVG